MKTALELTPDEWDAYDPNRTLTQTVDHDLAVLHQHAWNTAKDLAEELRSRFAATKIVVFGSLVHEGWFSRWSDIDLAVWGILPEDFYRAISFVTGYSSEFAVDLVDPEFCDPKLQKIINQEGIEI